ncbi:CopY/TcrY family copper transport repressor [Fructilactobacillus fructivorans]|uniref:CopY/TcrY family copper transport repressor n=1 Tax=Fructilactobacillus fructivorans TaxID=1614 RepID=A0AAE6NZP0_9LACO|nr:CopY/TcrY family copper transport repressor [Fructilactobacillus fructivorans]RDV64911.1 CopY/TcrY family copper transport repressor [Fructilactobacillus fructivorans]
MIELNEVKKIDEITHAEWQIVRLIWTMGASSSRSIIDAVASKRDWKESTIKTLLGRLVKKGLLTRVKQGQHFVYSSTVSEQNAMNLSAEELFKQMCDMRKGQTIMDLVSQSKISKGDINQLVKMLNQKLKTAPDKVDCNCLPGNMNMDCQ